MPGLLVTNPKRTKVAFRVKGNTLNIALRKSKYNFIVVVVMINLPTVAWYRKNIVFN